MAILRSIMSGLVGSVTLNALHETGRRVYPGAPRVDLATTRAAEMGLDRAGVHVESERNLYLATLGGDIISNTAYYSLVGVGGRRGALLRGFLLGLLAGIAAVLVPFLSGFGRKEVTGSPARIGMTVGYYTLGGLVAGLSRRLMG